MCSHKCILRHTERDITCLLFSHTPQHTQHLCSPTVRSGELLPAFREAVASGNESKAVKLVTSALRQLKLSRLKPDTTLNSALSCIAKENPQLLSAPAIIEGLVAVLKREMSVIFKAKSNPAVYVLVMRLLLIALKDSSDWPEGVAKVLLHKPTQSLYSTLPLIGRTAFYGNVW